MKQAAGRCKISSKISRNNVVSQMQSISNYVYNQRKLKMLLNAMYNIRKCAAGYIHFKINDVLITSVFREINEYILLLVPFAEYSFLIHFGTSLLCFLGIYRTTICHAEKCPLIGPTKH